MLGTLIVQTILRCSQSPTSCSVSLFVVFALFTRTAIGQTVAEQNAIRALEQAEARREARLAGYSVTEEYAIMSRRFDKSAAMTIKTLYRQGEGKSYEVIVRTGSSILQTRVFDKLLQEEAEMSRGEARRRAMVNSENYVMRLAGEETRAGRECYVLELMPRAKSPHLLKGHAWIDKEDGSLIRIEGRPMASPSFLTGRPAVVRDYEKISDFWLAKSSRAVSDSLFLGKTELSIDYLDYHLLNEESKRSE
jgi:hypothetical protein